jgi:squalene monooxygenase
VIFNDISILKNLLKEKDFCDYNEMNKVFKKFIKQRVNCAATTNILANCLHQIFANESMKSLRRSVMEYFNLGGVCVSGPIDFLSVLDPRPFYLLYHFFSVGIYGSYVIMKSSKNIFSNFIYSVNNFYIATKLVFPMIINNKILF